jgi:hypothetical protein
MNSLIAQSEAREQARHLAETLDVQSAHIRTIGNRNGTDAALLAYAAGLATAADAIWERLARRLTWSGPYTNHMNHRRRAALELATVKDLAHARRSLAETVGIHSDRNRRPGLATRN